MFLEDEVKRKFREFQNAAHEFGKRIGYFQGEKGIEEP